MFSTTIGSIESRFHATFVRIVGGRYAGDVGCMFDDNGSDDESRPYNVGLMNADCEDFFSANEMIPWIPRQGDRVIEAGVDGDYGTVLSSLNGLTVVLWDAFTEPQEWRDDEIEPADTSASASVEMIAL